MGISPIRKVRPSDYLIGGGEVWRRRLAQFYRLFKIRVG